MKKQFIPFFMLILYTLFLIKVMIFKDVPPLHIGLVTLDFGGTNGSNPANFVPFKTILPYVLGDKGLLIGGLNLVGNIALLVPVGILIPFIYRNITWKKTLVLAIASGLLIEGIQVMLRVGIFDIDDVILNAFGLMIGYFVYKTPAQWQHSIKAKTILIASTLITVATATFFVGTIYQEVKQAGSVRGAVKSAQSEVTGNEEGETPLSRDPCGGTGGNGEIVSVENNGFTLKRKDRVNQIVNLTAQATINTSAGSATFSVLKVGERVTLVGGPNPDGSFTAEAIFICSGSGTEM